MVRNSHAIEATRAVNVKPLKTGFQLSVNAEALPKPPKTMAATWVTAHVEGSDVALVFGQHLPGADRLIAALVVRMTVERVRDVLYANPTFLDRVRDFATMAYPDRVGLRELDFPVDGRVVFERASIAYLAQAGEEAEARFYWVSAAGLRGVSEAQGKVKDNSELVVPIVGVALDTSLLLDLCERLVALVGPPRQGAVLEIDAGEGGGV